MFGWGKRQEEKAIDEIIVNEAHEHGQYDANNNCGERFDDMLSAGIQHARYLGIENPEKIAEYADAYANGYGHAVFFLELEDDRSIDPYTKPKS